MIIRTSDESRCYLVFSGLGSPNGALRISKKLLSGRYIPDNFQCVYHLSGLTMSINWDEINSVWPGFWVRNTSIALGPWNESSIARNMKRLMEKPYAPAIDCVFLHISALLPKQDYLKTLIAAIIGGSRSTSFPGFKRLYNPCFSIRGMTRKSHAP